MKRDIKHPLSPVIPSKSNRRFKRRRFMIAIKVGLCSMYIEKLQKAFITLCTFTSLLPTKNVINAEYKIAVILYCIVICCYPFIRNILTDILFINEILSN